VGPQVQFPPKTQCDWWGAEKRRFDPRTALNRAYTPPTCSDGADHWRILQLAVWAFRAYVGSHANFPPKFRYARGGPQTGGVLKHGDLTLVRDCVEHILCPRSPMALIIGASGRSQSGLSEHVWVHMSISRHKTQMYSYTYIHAYV